MAMSLHHRRRDADLRRSSLQAASLPSDSSSRKSTSQRDSCFSSRSLKNPPTQPASCSTSCSRPSQSSSTSTDKKETPPMPPQQQRYFPHRPLRESPQASADSCISFVDSDDDLDEEVEDDDDVNLQFALPAYTVRRSPEPPAVPSTPSDFSELFPSRRKLKVRHDDTTLDGNMNLRIDTKVTAHNGRQCDMTLFHLRMHDLQTREFSLRRYCRDSGREVCNSARRKAQPAPPPGRASQNHQRRPSLQRSLSNALNSLRPRSDSKLARRGSSGGGSNPGSGAGGLKRNDSGYGSLHSVDFDRLDASRSGRDAPNQTPAASATAPIKLEFSNYAQVDVKRAGTRARARYEFDYWGTHYVWRRVTRKDTPSPTFHLTRAGGGDEVVAYIVPASLSGAQEAEERRRGGWVPPCSMWIADEKIVASQKDISDVIVASGLIVLVDSAIYAHFYRKEAVRLSFPTMPTMPTMSETKRRFSDLVRRASLSSRGRSNSWLRST